MTKLILAMMAAALVALVYYNRRLTDELREDRRAMKTESAKIAQVEHEMEGAQAQRLQEAERIKLHIVELQKQIQERKIERDSLAGSLTTMKNLSSGSRQVSTVKWDLDHKKETIDKIDGQLKSVVSQRQGLESQQRNATSQTKAQKQETDLQFDRQIESQVEKVSKMEYDYGELKANKLDVTAQDAARKMQGQIKDEKVILGQMRLQKKQYDISGAGSSASPEVAANISYLKNEESQLRGDLQMARADYQKLQEQYAAAKKTDSTEKNDSSSVQRKIADLESAIKSTSDQLAVETQRLRELQAPGPN